MPDYLSNVTLDAEPDNLYWVSRFVEMCIRDRGYTGTAAFRKLGYNSEVLGFARIHNTTKRIRREARLPEGFHEGARGGVRIPGGGNNQTEGASAPSDDCLLYTSKYSFGNQSDAKTHRNSVQEYLFVGY